MNNKTFPDFKTSNFPIMISNIIDNCGMQIDDLAKKCRLHRSSITNLKNGSRVSKNIIIIVCIVLAVSLQDTMELLKNAGYELSLNSNTDKAYIFFLQNHIIDVDVCEEMISEWNNQIKSPYKMDKIMHLHRKNN
jgi:plasmid maintenance system antidote protein VapI